MKWFENSKMGFVLIGFVFASMFAQPMRAFSQTADWIVYNTSNSDLPQNLITALTCDDRGNVWIGTGDPIGNGRGLVKFDGNNWTVFNTSNSPLPYNAIFALTPDGYGGVWIGTAGGLTSVGRGLAHFDGQNWMVYDTSNSGLPHNNVMALALDAQGNLWIGTDGGLTLFDGVNWQVYNRANSGLPHNSVYAIAIDDQQNKWVGTYGGGLAMFDGTNWEVFNRTNSGLPHNNVYSIAIDHKQNKWIGTAVHISGTVGGGLAKFDGNDWTVYNKANSKLPHDDVYAVAVDVDGSVWAGTGEHIPASVGGLVRFDGINWTVYDKQNSGMPYNLVYTIAIDRRGNKWAGSVNFDEPGGLAVCRVGAQPIFDYNDDGIVDSVDMRMMIDYWGTDEPLYDIAPQPFGDGFVDIQDLVLLAEHLFEEIYPPELVAYWKLNETEGIIAYDTAGINDAVVVGGTTWQPDSGQVDGALHLDGIDGYALTSPILNPADGPFSVFAWIKGGEPGQVVLSQANGANWLRADPDSGCLMTELIPPAVGRSVPQPLKSEYVITDGQWHRIGFIWDGINRTLYVDGMEVTKDADPLTSLESSDGSLYIGANKNFDAGIFFSGLIDDVRIYNKALTPEQIGTLTQ